MLWNQLHDLTMQRMADKIRDETAAVLAQTTCDLVFVRGNHEDHFWLDSLERQGLGPRFPVDAYQRIYCLKTGSNYVYAKDNEQISILGIGRIGPRSQDTQNWRYIQPDAQARLQTLDALPVDILLTHDIPAGTSSRHVGMGEITTDLEKFQPRYHFYGHVGGKCLLGFHSFSYALRVKISANHFKFISTA
jgi:hypothetical protein